MKSTLNEYQVKKVDYLCNKYNFSEFDSTMIVEYCCKLNNGLMIHWIIEGASKYVANHRELPTFEALKEYKMAINSIDSISIKDKVLSRTIDSLDKDTRELKNIQYNHCNLKDMDIKDKTFYEFTAKSCFYSIIAYCNVLNIDANTYFKTVNLPLFYKSIFYEFESKDSEGFYNERISNDKFYKDRELHNKENYFYELIYEMIKFYDE